MKRITLFSFFFVLATFIAIGQQASISGSILNPDGTAAAGAIVKLLNAQGGLVAETAVDGNGNYLFSGITTGQEYTVAPEIPGQPLLGVSTFDIVRGAQHILGRQRLDSPLQLLAGDVNQSNSLTTFDLILIRQLIIGTVSGLPQDWRFIRTDIQFQDDSNPWLGFTASSPTFLLEDDVAGFDFYAIKLGDLSW